MDSGYRTEIIRKAIHFCSLSIPIIYYFIPRGAALSLVIPLTLVFLIVDLARYYYQPIQPWFYKMFGWLLREHEADERKRRLNGATYILISASLCIIIFPKFITVTSFAILIICDLTAALIGRRFGKHRFLGKSLEGSIAFFISGIVVIFLTPKIGHHPVEYIIAIVAVAIGACVEALSIDIDDNLSVPLTVGISIWAGYYYLLPTLNIFKFG